MPENNFSLLIIQKKANKDNNTPTLADSGSDSNDSGKRGKKKGLEKSHRHGS